MIFHEVYSAYYNALAEILSKIIDGETNEKELEKVVWQKAFGESVLSIFPSLKSQKWQLVHGDMSTPLKNKPTMPVTTLQKRWLKAISLDPRIKLFDVQFDWLDDVQPLFCQKDFVVYDKYNDGDPYGDQNYVSNFKTVLSATKSGDYISFEITDKRNKQISVTGKPVDIEYSAKDDKFRVSLQDAGYVNVVNLAKISHCAICKKPKRAGGQPKQRECSEVVLQVSDQRNTLERAMMHFAHFEKQAEMIDDHNCLLKIKYDATDESEMIIRILSFGPMIKVVESDRIKNGIKQKLKKQKNCGLL